MYIDQYICYKYLFMNIFRTKILYMFPTKILILAVNNKRFVKTEI